jgi:regulator of RNase E activity RraA
MKFYDPMPIGEETRNILGRVATATLSSQLVKRGLRSTYMQAPRPLNPKAARFVGPAYTVRMVPAREDITELAFPTDPDFPQRKAIEATPPGHVVVFDCRGDTRGGIVGDILVERLRVRGVAGLCTDGAVRDSAAVAGQDFPVFCAAVTAPYSMIVHHPIDDQQPIACGGVTVLPGDILVGDIEGVIVIPSPLAQEVAEAAAAQEHLESYIFEKVGEGGSINDLYPPNEAALADYERWRKERGG